MKTDQKEEEEKGSCCWCFCCCCCCCSCCPTRQSVGVFVVDWGCSEGVAFLYASFASVPPPACLLQFPPWLMLWSTTTTWVLGFLYYYFIFYSFVLFFYAWALSFVAIVCSCNYKLCPPCFYLPFLVLFVSLFLFSCVNYKLSYLFIYSIYLFMFVLCVCLVSFVASSFMHSLGSRLSLI